MYLANKACSLRNPVWIAVVVLLAMLLTGCERKALKFDYNRDTSTAHVVARTEKGIIEYTADALRGYDHKLVLVPRSSEDEVLVSVVDLRKGKFYFVGKKNGAVVKFEQSLSTEILEAMKHIYRVYEEGNKMPSGKVIQRDKPTYGMYPLFFEDIHVHAEDASNALGRGAVVYIVDAGNLHFQFYTQSNDLRIDKVDESGCPLYVKEIESYWRIIGGYYDIDNRGADDIYAWRIMESETLEEVKDRFGMEFFPILHMEGPMKDMARDLSMKDDLYRFAFYDDQKDELIEAEPSDFQALQLSRENYTFSLEYRRPLVSESLWILSVPCWEKTGYRPLLGGRIHMLGGRTIELAPNRKD